VAGNENDGRVHKLLDGRRLLRLARLSFAGEEDIELECSSASNRRLEADRRLGEWCVDEIAVAHLVNLASALAADPRRLSSVLAEHLGRPVNITAHSLRIALAGLTWYRKQDNLALDMECPHEVIDYAVEQLVAVSRA